MLCGAAERGDVAEAQRLLEQGAPIEALACGGKTSDGRDVLWTPLLWAGRWGRASAIPVLVAARADVEASDVFRRTPLRHAAGCGHAATCAALLEAEAEVDVRDVN